VLLPDTSSREINQASVGIPRPPWPEDVKLATCLFIAGNTFVLPFFLFSLTAHFPEQGVSGAAQRHFGCSYAAFGPLVDTALHRPKGRQRHACNKDMLLI